MQQILRLMQLLSGQKFTEIRGYHSKEIYDSGI
jgi:hypothetical protein